MGLVYSFIGFLEQIRQSLPAWVGVWVTCAVVVLFVAGQFFNGMWRISERNRKQDEMEAALKTLKDQVHVMDEAQDGLALQVGLLTQQGERTEKLLDNIYKEVIKIPQRIAKGSSH